jgi:hypothetical protein
MPGTTTSKPGAASESGADRCMAILHSREGIVVRSHHSRIIIPGGPASMVWGFGGQSSSLQIFPKIVLALATEFRKYPRVPMASLRQKFALPSRPVTFEETKV